MKKINVIIRFYIIFTLCFGTFISFAEGDFEYDKNSLEDSAYINYYLKESNIYIKQNYSSVYDEIKDNYFPEYIYKNGKKQEANYSLFKKYGLFLYYSEDSLDNFHKKVGDDYIAYDFNGNLVKNPFIYENKLFDKNTKFKKFKNNINSSWSSMKKKESQIKNKILSNIKKTLKNNYPDKNISNIMKILNQKDYEEYINLEVLPTTYSYGIVSFLTEDDLIIKIPITYQDDLGADLTIKHVTVEKLGSSYILSEKFSLMNSTDKLSFKYGEIKNIKSKSSKVYDCIGNMVFKNKKSYDNILYDENGNKKFFSGLNSSKSLNYEYFYDEDNENPILVFFYIKVHDSNLKMPKANIKFYSDKYDVPKSIPTGEKINGIVKISSGVLAEYSITKYDSTQEVDVVNKFSKNSRKIKLKSINVGGSYYKVDYYSIYHLKEINVFNKKLNKYASIKFDVPVIDDSVVKIYSKNVVRIDYHGPKTIGNRKVKYDYHDFIMYPKSNKNDSENLDEEIREEASSHFVSEVRNDLLIIGGQVILEDSVHYNNTSEPKSFKEIAIDSIKDNLLIKNIMENGNAETTGELIYKKVLGQGDDEKIVKIKGDSIFVHTPVFNDTKFYTDEKFDQGIEAKNMIVPLDHIMKLDMKTKGKHIEKKGYGDRNYEEHTKEKVLNLAFDAYVSKKKEDLEKFLPNKQFYYKANQNIKFNTDVETLYYKAAPWAKEGLSKIKTTMFSMNSKNKTSMQDTANLDYKNYIASKEKVVDIRGRIFDFSIEKVLDPLYLDENINSYWSLGLNNKEGKRRKRFEGVKDEEAYKLILPITKEKAKVFKTEESVKLGYPFIFSIKTMGENFHKDDLVFAKASFFHMDNNGNIDNNISLFYKEKDKLIEIGSKEDKLSNSLTYKDIASQRDLLDIIEGEKSLLEKSGNNNYLDFSLYSYKTSKPVFVYKSDLWILSYPMRTFIGPLNNLPDGLDKSDSLLSVQKWKGIYSLPTTTLVFKKENNKVDMSKPIKNGFLGLKFEIYLSEDKNQKGEKLAFITNHSDEYINESYVNKQYGKTYLRGTLILYSIDKNANLDLNRR